jgi:hypothetical protein
MAATGMGGGRAWGPLPGGREAREGLMLDTVKVAVELGVDINAVNTDGRTALDAATALKYETVTAYLKEKGAKPGTGTAAPSSRGKDSGRSGEPR